MQELNLQTEAPPASVAEPIAQKPSTGPGAMIVFDGVTKIYEPDVTALRDVSFVIDKGDFVFIVGASGSGKSTIIRLLLKEIEPTQGRINVGGRDLGRLERSKVPNLRRSLRLIA